MEKIKGKERKKKERKKENFCVTGPIRTEKEKINWLEE